MFFWFYLKLPQFVNLSSSLQLSKPMQDSQITWKTCFNKQKWGKSRFRHLFSLRFVNCMEGKRQHSPEVNFLTVCQIHHFFINPAALERLAVVFENPATEAKIQLFFICSKRPFWWIVFKNNIQKFQRVFILEKNSKVRNRPKRT